MKKDTNELIGKLIESAAVGRDAIHVAVAPVVARDNLVPGQHIGFVTGSTELVSGSTSTYIGIVDPFLRQRVSDGQRFFMFLYPRTITSLRHEWTHPAFGENSPAPVRESEVAESEAWLRQYAIDLKPYETPEEAYASLIQGLRAGEVYGHGKDLHGFGDLDSPDELKEHAERVLGIKIDWETFSFTCGC